MVICTIPDQALADCEWMFYGNGSRECVGRAMFEGHCPCRKVVEDAPADEGSRQAQPPTGQVQQNRRIGVEVS